MGEWQLLGLPGDPIVADVGVIRDKVSHYRSLTEGMRTSADRLHRIASRQELVGLYADELRISSGQVADDLDRVVGRYDAVASALDTYEPELEHALAESAAALDDAVAADGAARAAAGMPTAQATDGQPLTSDQQAQNDEKSARTRQAADQLSAARARLDRALGGLDDAGRRAAGTIRQGFGDGLKDTGWQKFLHGLVKVLKIVVKILTYVAMALAAIALVIPGLGEVILAIGAAIAAVTVVADAFLAATGNASWADFGIAIAGLLTFGAGKVLGPLVQKVLKTVGSAIKNSVGKALQAGRAGFRGGRPADIPGPTVVDDAPQLDAIPQSGRWTTGGQDDLELVDDYTGGGYDAVNSYLRGNDGVFEHAVAVGTPTAARDAAETLIRRIADASGMKHGLERLPGATGIVRTYRGVRDFPTDLASTLRPGDLFSDPAFMSTSTRLGHAAKFIESGEPNSFLFSIEGTSGRDVAAASAFQRENEVVYLPGTRFEVVSITTSRAHQVPLIRLREVPAPAPAPAAPVAGEPVAAAESVAVAEAA